MKIALWRLGSLEHRIVPTKESIEKVKELINVLKEKKEGKDE